MVQGKVNTGLVHDGFNFFQFINEDNIKNKYRKPSQKKWKKTLIFWLLCSQLLQWQILKWPEYMNVYNLRESVAIYRTWPQRCRLEFFDYPLLLKNV